MTRRRNCILRTLAAALALGALSPVLAQIGLPPAAFVEVAGLHLDTAAGDGPSLRARTERGAALDLTARGSALARVGGEERLDAAAIDEVARLVGAATGYFAAIERPVADFLNQNLGAMVGSGPLAIGVDRFELTLDVRGDAAPYQVAWSIALSEVDEDAFLPVRHALGPADARYVIREFSDLQCPFCAQFAAQVVPAIEATLLARGDVRFEYHHLTLGARFANSGRAAQATECVADANPEVPGAFWSYLDALFERQQAWSTLGDPDPYFARLPGEIGLSGGGVAACLAADTYADLVRTSTERAFELGVGGTPTVFVGPFKLADFSRIEAYLQAMALIDAFAAEE